MLQTGTHSNQTRGARNTSESVQAVEARQQEQNWAVDYSYSLGRQTTGGSLMCTGSLAPRFHECSRGHYHEYSRY